MNQKIKEISTIGIKGLLFGIACWGWWGFFYPEYTLVEGTYRIVQESGEVEEEMPPDEIYQQMIQARPEQIRIKSKLLERLLILTSDGQK